MVVQTCVPSDMKAITQYDARVYEACGSSDRRAYEACFA